MGTVVVICMLLGFPFAARLPVLQKLPRPVHMVVGTLLLAAGLWNVLWYAVQHIGEFWGFNALISGLLMIVAATLILIPGKVPAIFIRWRPVILVLLLCYALLYAITIYRL